MPLANYILALVATLGFEIIIAILFGLRKKTHLFAVLLINFITHPVLHFLFLILLNSGIKIGMPLVCLLEIFVAATEWVLLVYMFQRPVFKLMLFSITANLTSFLAGLLIFGL